MRKLRKTEEERGGGAAFPTPAPVRPPFPSLLCRRVPLLPFLPGCLPPSPVSQDAAQATILGEGWHEMEVRTRAGAICHYITSLAYCGRKKKQRDVTLTFDLLL
ncbi:hypothetical protein SKAU_G00221740 [Synaphobranchus kaupii]|uniref:Uncharacterized protein n=1 Tax=Synaphobranchus kaupii TaxID=118154 RepID=A0A9Q1FB58_SYNKA|nr:hypothetical protein SKAU_G00221740 [Synaphobranchus kaupii]